jgi:hypothetical protein
VIINELEIFPNPTGMNGMPAVSCCVAHRSNFSEYLWRKSSNERLIIGQTVSLGGRPQLELCAKVGDGMKG